MPSRHGIVAGERAHLFPLSKWISRTRFFVPVGAKSSPAWRFTLMKGARVGGAQSTDRQLFTLSREDRHLRESSITDTH